MKLPKYLNFTIILYNSIALLPNGIIGKNAYYVISSLYLNKHSSSYFLSEASDYQFVNFTDMNCLMQIFCSCFNLPSTWEEIDSVYVTWDRESLVISIHAKKYRQAYKLRVTYKSSRGEHKVLFSHDWQWLRNVA